MRESKTYVCNLVDKCKHLRYCEHAKEHSGKPNCHIGSCGAVYGHKRECIPVSKRYIDIWENMNG